MEKIVNLPKVPKKTGRKKTLKHQLFESGELSADQVNFISAFVKARGVIGDACKIAGIARDTYYRWMKTNAPFNALITRASEEPLDYVRGKLFQKIDQGNITAILAFLRAHDEKFGDRVTIDGKLGLSASWYDELKGKKEQPVFDRGSIGELQHNQFKQLDRAVEAGDAELVNTLVEKAKEKTVQRAESEPIDNAEVRPE